MTPNVRDVLSGVAVALARPLSPDVGPEYAAGRFGIVSTLAMLAAQEAEKTAGAAIGENADIRALFADDASAYDAALGGRLAKAAAQTDADLSVPALDAANAALRRLLIELHETVENAGDAATDAKIVALYVRMAAGRRLTLGG
jgi:hypothetical protein